MALIIKDNLLQQLNKNDSAMLKYIYQHSDTICSISIKDLAEELNCAPSSVTRLCKKIGYSGFSELKFCLHQVPPVEEDNDSDSSPSYQSIVADISTNISGTAGLLQEEVIYKVASLLNSDIPVYLYYPGGITDNLVKYFEKLLMINGRPNVYQLHSSKITAHLIQNIPEQGIIFFISASGSWHQTVRQAQEANLHNMITIGITPVYNNDVAIMCKYNLRFFAQHRENKGTEYTSRICIFYLIDTLIEFYRELRKGR